MNIAINLLVANVNLDLLKFTNHLHTDEFRYILNSNGLSPTITLPTRITPTTAALIDNISVSFGGQKSISVIVLTSVSN